MNIARKTIGWFCFLSLLAAIFCAGCWVFGVIALSGRGAGVYYWSVPETLDQTQSALLARAVSKPDASVMRAYAERAGTWTTHAYDWWDVIELWLENWITRGEARRPTVTDLPQNQTVAAWLMDNEGATVASYPVVLKHHLGALSFSMPNDSVSVPMTPQWEDLFSRLKLYRKGIEDIDVRRIRGARGQTVGYLASVSAGPGEVVLMPEGAREGVLGTVGLFNLSLLALLTYSVTLPIWVAMDAGWRGMRRVPWALLVIVTGWIGLLAYVIARLPPQRPCPNCGSPVFAKYKRCPACGVSIAARCPICRTVMKAGWQYCPKCSGVEPQPPLIEDAVLVPEDVPVAQDAPVLPTKGVCLVVRVVDASSNAPIPGAVVVVEDRPHLQGLTKGDGTFELWRLEPGSYTISASKQGYEAGQAQTEVTENSQGSVEIALAAKPGRVTGRVLDRATLTPLVGARVELDSTRVERSAESGSDGSFALDDIPPGPYTVRAEAAGFADQMKLVEVAPGQPAPLDFALERGEEPPAAGEGGNA